MDVFCLKPKHCKSVNILARCTIMGISMHLFLIKHRVLHLCHHHYIVPYYWVSLYLIALTQWRFVLLSICFSICYCLKIHLFERMRDRQRKKVFLPLVHSSNGCQQIARAEPAEARCLETHLSVLHWWQAFNTSTLAEDG